MSNKKRKNKKLKILFGNFVWLSFEMCIEIVRVFDLLLLEDLFEIIDMFTENDLHLFEHLGDVTAGEILVALHEIERHANDVVLFGLLLDENVVDSWQIVISLAKVC